MAKIPENENTTVHQIYRHYELQSGPGWRDHLGFSIIGERCLRKLWYAFRWCTPSKFSGRVLRLFERGRREEQWITEDLRAIGTPERDFPSVTVYDVDPSTGQQFTFSICGGHVGGSMDAAILGLPEAPKTWHVGEYKTHNDKSFKDLVKNGVEKSKPLHWAQMQCYMGESGMKRAAYIAVNKNDDSIYMERIKYDKSAHQKLIKKAETVVFAPEPLEPVSQRADWYECKFCDHRAICHCKAIPAVNCRTCAHSTPEREGGWSCAIQSSLKMDKLHQEVGCPCHLFIPALIPHEYLGADEVDIPTWTKYRTEKGTEFYNVVDDKKAVEGNYYTSGELHCIDPIMLDDKFVSELKSEFGAKVAG